MDSRASSFGDLRTNGVTPIPDARRGDAAGCTSRTTVPRFISRSTVSPEALSRPGTMGGVQPPLQFSGAIWIRIRHSTRGAGVDRSHPTRFALVQLKASGTRSARRPKRHSWSVTRRASGMVRPGTPSTGFTPCWREPYRNGNAAAPATSTHLRRR